MSFTPSPSTADTSFGHSLPSIWRWEGEPAKESIEKLEAVGLKSVVFDPCGNVPESGDFLAVTKANVEALEKAFP